MDATYWVKQGSEPLFPELLWSRPENRQLAGKLLIIGGNAHSFNAPAEAYQAAEKAGVGISRVLLPDAVQKLAGKIIETVEYAPSTPSGSFGREALGIWLEQAAWADAVLLAGGIGHNSETNIVLEQFIHDYNGLLTVTEDALDAFVQWPQKLFSRDKTLVVAAFGQLQKIWPKLVADRKPIKYSQDLAKVVELLHQLTQKIPTVIVVKHHDALIVAHAGKVSTTTNHDEIWRVKTAASATVWWLQNSSKPFEAATTSLAQ